MRKRIVSPDLSEEREELLQPSRFLGYDRDSLGMYALSREMFDIAESQFTRAARLNPYEPRFKQHLAWCLYKQSKYAEAMGWIDRALKQKPDDNDNKHIRARITQRLRDRSDLTHHGNQDHGKAAI